MDLVSCIEGLNNLLEDFRLHLPTVINSFRTLYCTVGAYSNPAEAINASREITLTHVATRGKPNAFNYCHQLERMVSVGESREQILEQWSNPKALP